SGFKFSIYSNTNLYGNNIENCYFEQGLIHINDKQYNQINLNLIDSIIKNNYSPNHGTVINIYSNIKYSHTLYFNNTLIEKNKSDDCGGVIYSENESIQKKIFFTNCTFLDNNAVMGI
ncbi:hypothetical protein PIROE2DRAFT_18500, partial [Piromyces sp. E2]